MNMLHLQVRIDRPLGIAGHRAAVWVAIEWAPPNSYFTITGLRAPNEAEPTDDDNRWYVANSELVYEMCRAALATRRGTVSARYAGLGVHFEGITACVVGAGIDTPTAFRFMSALFG